MMKDVPGPMTKYESYALSEWKDFQASHERFEASMAAVRDRKVSRVLDVGCGAGQELLPFVQNLGSRVTGVDVSPEAVEIARRQFSKLGYEGQSEFVCSPAESLPFESGTFDVVICRLALPYTRNEQALAEMARVLRRGGLLILKIHHARWYGRRFWRALRSGHLHDAAVFARSLLNGTFYHLTGRQPQTRLLGGEVFQTRWMLRRIMSRFGL
ncbi:MAG: hypothetical protein C5B56_07120, partial [Proteobacteria bacterium]